MRLPYAIAALSTMAVAAVLASCGGGGHGSALPPSRPGGAGLTTLPPVLAGTQNVTISIKIPGRGTSATRRAAYIGAGTQSATIAATAIVASATPTPTPAPTPTPGPSSTPVPPPQSPPPTVSTSVNCTATCTATLSVPVGLVQFTVTLYDQPTPAPTATPTPAGATPTPTPNPASPIPPPPPGPANAVSTGSITTVVGTGTTSINLTFSGVPSTVQLAPQIAAIPAGAATTIPVVMNVLDADGNVIIPSPVPTPPGTPVPFSVPYAFFAAPSAPPSGPLPTPAANAHVALSPASIPSPGAMLTLTYDGDASAAGVQYLYSQNAAVNGGTTQVAGSIVIGATPTPFPATSASPSPPPVPTSSPGANLFPIYFVNNSGRNGAVNVYVYGLSASDATTWQYVTSNGSPAAMTGTPFPPITLAAPGSGEVDVPPLCSARIYVALDGGKLAINLNAAGGVAAPAPWSGDASTSTVFDLMEYTWQNLPNAPATCKDTPMGLDLSSVDFVGVPMSLQLQQNGTISAPVGPMPGAGSRLIAGLNALGPPWSSLVQTFPGGQRVVNPAHAIGGPFNFPPTYFASYMNAICNAYPTTGSKDLVLGGTIPNPAGPTAAPISLLPGLASPAPTTPPVPYPYVFGRFSGSCGTPSQVLTFWSGPNMTGNVVAAYAGVPSSADAFGNAGYFAANAPTSTTQTPQPVTIIGRILSVSIDRGTIPPTPSPPPGMPTAAPSATPFAQPVCDPTQLYGGALTNNGATPLAWFTTDWYSALLHANAFGNSVYAFADDDECGLYAPFITAGPTPGPTQTFPPNTRFVVTLEPF